MFLFHFYIIRGHRQHKKLLDDTSVVCTKMGMANKTSISKVNMQTGGQFFKKKKGKAGKISAANLQLSQTYCVNSDDGGVVTVGW